jgi:hypothetical protein
MKFAEYIPNLISLTEEDVKELRTVIENEHDERCSIAEAREFGEALLLLHLSFPSQLGPERCKTSDCIECNQRKPQPPLSPQLSEQESRASGFIRSEIGNVNPSSARTVSKALGFLSSRPGLRNVNRLIETKYLKRDKWAS